MLRSTLIVLALSLATLAAPPAFAADDPFDLDDDDDSSGDDDKSDDETVIPPPKDQTQKSDDPDDDADWTDEPVDPERAFKVDDDELEDDIQSSERREGQDDSRIYREQLEKMDGLGADEEALAWERYLKKYPNSQFRGRIEERMDDLARSLYDERLEVSTEGGLMDAGAAELRFAQPMLLESIDPRTKLRFGFELGFPSWLNGTVDYEHQLKRNWSVHGGIRGRYTGASVEAGTRYALVKSARTNLLVTGVMDLRLNVTPVVFPALRPLVGIGKRFDLLEGLDVQAQVGSDLSFQGGFSPRLVGGLNVQLAPAETVRVYAETSTYMKDLFTQDLNGGFRFNVVTFGLKFIWRKGKTSDRGEFAAGASVPYTSNYWAYHFGSVLGDGNIYF